jgi:hypothetical protein
VSPLTKSENNNQWAKLVILRSTVVEYCNLLVRVSPLRSRTVQVPAIITILHKDYKINTALSFIMFNKQSCVLEVKTINR